MQKTVTHFASFVTLTVLGGSALAQTPPPPPPVHHGIFSKLFHPKPKPGQTATGSFGQTGHMTPGRPGMGGIPSTGGSFIGNKNSHIYHMPGDKGSMPAAQNRVYFRSAAAAEAAGYHLAGSGSHTKGQPSMHGSPMHGTPGSMTHITR